MDWTWLDWAAAAVLGGLVGTSELVSRFKDDPPAAIKSLPGLFYIAINSIASLAALGLIHGNNLFPASPWTRILLAGVSAMAFFRTSLFVVRVGNSDVGIGPSGFLGIFLSAADAGVDRTRAAERSEAVVTTMKGVDYDKAKVALPPFCVALMQNVSEGDQKELGRSLKDIEDKDAGPEVKALLLGIELMNVVGVDVLTAAVDSLGDQIRSSPGAAGS